MRDRAVPKGKLMEESQQTETTGTDQPNPGAAPPGGESEAGAGRGEEEAGWEGGGWHVHDESARDWVGQLQNMIDNVAEHAGPVLREVAAKAAELAGVAAENAGPALQKAATVTTEVGQKVAARSKEYAAELRRQSSTAAPAQAPGEPPADEPAAGQPEGGSQPGGGEPLA
ncbi:MAG: hypothetical protein ACP5VP_02070 [Candidatus Limnocylindrales bacterium]